MSRRWSSGPRATAGPMRQSISSRARGGSPPTSNAACSTAAPTSRCTAPRTFRRCSPRDWASPPTWPARTRGTASCRRAAARSMSCPAGATVGTSSARRAGLLAALYPGLRTVADTRQRRHPAAQARRRRRRCAGARVRRSRSPFAGRSLYAAARSDRCSSRRRRRVRSRSRRSPDPAAALACALVGDPATRVAVTAERAVLISLGGGCLLPLGRVGPDRGRTPGAGRGARGRRSHPPGRVVRSPRASRRRSARRSRRACDDRPPAAARRAAGPRHPDP